MWSRKALRRRSSIRRWISIRCMTTSQPFTLYSGSFAAGMGPVSTLSSQGTVSRTILSLFWDDRVTVSHSPTGCSDCSELACGIAPSTSSRLTLPMHGQVHLHSVCVAFSVSGVVVVNVSISGVSFCESIVAFSAFCIVFSPVSAVTISACGVAFSSASGVAFCPSGVAFSSVSGIVSVSGTWSPISPFSSASAFPSSLTLCSWWMVSHPSSVLIPASILLVEIPLTAQGSVLLFSLWCSSSFESASAGLGSEVSLSFSVSSMPSVWLVSSPLSRWETEGFGSVLASLLNRK
mmetsp:Transcript_19180/g.53431  ORF Transcript_19180/g.53431 Transcript_19180/m.53431 type:complete len:292 (+) Transcript_19180:708-1583(+)